MANLQTTWSGSLHLSFRLLPTPSPNLRIFVEADGKTEDQVLAKLPYQAQRARPGTGTGAPDRRRYRDGRQLYTMLGFLYEDAGKVRVTLLGRTVLEWLEILTEKNAPTLGLYAVRSLAAHQLRNPTTWGQKYDPAIEVFPFAFIWRAMLALNDQISSDELNRAIFHVTDDQSLIDAIERIREARKTGDVTAMGGPAISGSRVNDRIIPWVSMASFGYTLISDKEGGEYYKIRPEARPTLARAAAVRVEHRSFPSVVDYVEYVSDMAGLPHTHPLNEGRPAINKPALASAVAAAGAQTT